VVSKIGVRDYIPSVGDHHYYFLSDYRLLKWAMPFDKWIENGIDTMWVKKGVIIQKELEKRNWKKVMLVILYIITNWY
jgi:hypothetical protein